MTLRKHYFNFSQGEVDYSRSYVEDDKGIIKTVSESHNLQPSIPTSFTYNPVFFDNNGAKTKVAKSEDLVIDGNDIETIANHATKKISKCLIDLKKGFKNTIEKSDLSNLDDKELFSFIMTNPSLNYDNNVQEYFNNISEKFSII